AAADAFVEGMQGMLIACVMIGLGSAMQVLLQSSQILDSIVHGLSGLIQGHQRGIVADCMMGVQALFDLLIHSTSALATITVPILTPIAHLSGVSGQVTVSALLLGSGLTNMISPTNGLLLAFLAASRVSYVDWARFVAPLVAIYFVIGLFSLYVMASLNY
ncbi:MAG: YfcC family protein, partial [Steroidobacteraceae bacterium]